MVLTMADRDEAIAEWEKLRVLVHRRGSLLGMLNVNLWSGLTLLWRGDLRTAQERLEAANERLCRLGSRPLRATRTAQRSSAMPGGCAATSRERGRSSTTGQRDDDGSDGFAQLIRSPSDAAAREREVRRGVRAHLAAWKSIDAAIGYLPGWMPWRSLRARALAGPRADRSTRCRSHARKSRSHERFGAAGVLGRSLLVLGTVDPDDGIAHLRKAVEVLDRSTARLGLAAALAALGTALRLAPRPTEAREPLRRALELAHRCGADGLVQTVRTGAVRDGRAPANDGALRRRLAHRERAARRRARGRGSDEQGDRPTLYVTPKTVELHLSNSYRKLGIGSRHALAGALASSSTD